MLQQTIPMSRIVNRWAEALSTDEGLNKFCNDKYGKPAQLYVGYDDVDAPLEDDCPCIILLPSSKQEGFNDEYHYSLMIVWGIVHKGAIRDKNIIRYDGVLESDNLGQLIIECICRVNTAFPDIDIDYELDSMNWRPVFTGRLTATITIPHVIGGNIEY
jgi:hypothetical protein|nr:MAG TPA: hypothetical protein [Caudoviricetes sp.]